MAVNNVLNEVLSLNAQESDAGRVDSAGLRLLNEVLSLNAQECVPFNGYELDDLVLNEVLSLNAQECALALANSAYTRHPQ